jgi:hypothetical protein
VAKRRNKALFKSFKGRVVHFHNSPVNIRLSEPAKFVSTNANLIRRLGH